MTKYISVSLLSVFIGLASNSFAQRNNIVLESTFESKTSITQWYEQNLLNSWSSAISPKYKRAGSNSTRFELRRGVDVGNGPRAELGMAPQESKEFWYGFSLLFPTGYEKDSTPESVVQFQSMPDFILGEAWRSSPLFLGIMNDRFILDIKTDPNKVTIQGKYNFTRIDLGPVSKEVWSDWVFHVKWAYDNTGVLEIWKNNTKVVSRINLPNSYNDIKYPYFKIGIYKWEWSDPNTKSNTKSRIFFADEVRIGNSKATYNDVVPGETATATTLPIVPQTLKITKNTNGSFAVSFKASKTITKPSKFILYMSSDNGKTYQAIYSETALTLTINKVYNLTFKK